MLAAGFEDLNKMGKRPGGEEEEWGWKGAKGKKKKSRYVHGEAETPEYLCRLWMLANREVEPAYYFLGIARTLNRLFL